MLQKLLDFSLDLFKFLILVILRIAKYPSLLQQASYRFKMTQEGFVRLSKHTLVSYLIVSTVLVGSGLIFLFNPFGTNQAEAAWFNDNWAYRQSIPVTSTNGSAQSNVFLSFTLDTATLITAGKLRSACQDIRITDFAGNLLKYHIGRTNACNASNTTIDFLVSSFPDLKSTYYVYYGNPAAISADAGAFSQSQASNYSVASLATAENAPTAIAYWKLDDAQGTTLQDAMTTNADGVLTGSPAPTWQLDDQCISSKCVYFGGSTSRATVATSLSGVQSIAFWVRPTTVTTIGLMDFDGGTHKLSVSSGTISATGFTSPTIYVNGIVSSTLVTNQWQYVTVTTGTGFTGSAIKIAFDNTNYTTGFFDEVKIYNQALTAAQVAANYNARSNPEGVSQQQGNNTQNMPTALSQGLVGYWKTDETSGTASDSSGNGVTLTNNNTVAYAAGKFGNGASFTAASSMYLSTASTISGVKTVSFWTNNASTTDEYINLTASAYITSSSGTVSATGFTNPTIYVNGVLNGALTASVWNHVVVTTDTAINANQFEIGRGNGSYNNGKIDEARVYNRALSAADVAQLYNWTPGPVGYWKMDDGSGTTAVDSSGNANNAAITPGTGRFAPGKYSQAYNFDASATIMNAGSATSLDNLPAGAGMTTEAWIKPNSALAGTSWIMGKASNGNGDNGWNLAITTNGRISMNVDGSTDLVRNSAVGTVTFTGTWQHIAVTWTGDITDATTVKIYYNGKETTYSNTTNGAARVSDASSSLGLGGLSGSAGRVFDGPLDEAKIYSYPRTQAQIIEDMNAGHPAPGGPIGTPLGWWRFDEGYSTTANNNGSQGSVLAGTLTNMSSPATSTSGWTQSGKFGKGLIFEGTAGSSNDLVNMGSDSSIDDLTAKPMSLSAWIYPISIGEGSAGVIMAKNGNSTSPSAGWLWQLVSTTQLKFSVDGSTDLVVTSSGNPVTLNAWNHVALSWDGVFTTASSVHMYVNGREVTYGTQTNGATIVSDAANSLLVGNNNATSLANTFDGTIDEPKVYAQALTADQIKLDMNQGKSEVLGALSDNSSYQKNAANQEYCIPGDSTSCVAPVGRWDLDEGSGSTTQDQSGNANSGTITGATYINGKFNKALNFNGGTDTVTVSNSISTKTVEFWVNPSTTTQNLMDLRTAATAANISVSSGTISATGFTSPTIYVNGIVSSTLVANSWQHVGITTGTAITANAIRFGRVSSTSLTGKLDTIRFYDYARTPAQVAWDYNKGGPVGWWKMDECQGTSIKDASGNSNTGTLTVGASGTQTTAGTCNLVDTASAWYNGATGKRNYSINLDITDDYISSADSVSLSPTGSVSFGGWYKRTNSTANTLWIMAKGNIASGTTTGSYGVRFTAANALICSISPDGTSSNFKTITSTTSTYNDTNWHHIMCVANTSTTKLDMYIDGQLGATQVTGLSSIFDSSIGLMIGATPSDAGAFSAGSRGQLDDMRVYNYPLTATQVKSLYNDGAYRQGPVTGSP